MMKTLFAIAALSLAVGASAATTTVLTEGFNTTTAAAPVPTGWTQANVSSQGWFKDQGGNVVAQAGASDSFIAANYLSGPIGGNFDLWLLTPELNLINGASMSFFSKTAETGYLDGLEVLFSAGSNTALSSFTSLLTIGAGTLTTNWTQFTTSVASYSGTGRFAFRYVGSYDNSNYIGLDTVSVVTTAATGTVPEPTSLALLGLGVAGFVAARRKQQRA